MAEFERDYARTQPMGRAQAGVIDEGLRAYMIRVYNYMAAGVAITGVIAYVVALYAVAPDQASAVATLQNGVPLTQLGATLFTSPMVWIVMLAPLAMVFFLGARMGSMSLSGAQLSFWIFAALMGLSMSTIFLTYTQTSITRVFFIAAAMFGSLSLYGYTTKKDLSGWGSFLFMGLIGVFIAMIVNIFLASSMLQFVISVIGVLVFAGLTAYDTQQIKEMYNVSDDGSVAGRKAVMGALHLYLDFINLFLMLLRLFGNRQ